MDGVVVVTGANGHIGNNLCKDLVAHGYSVKGTVRSMDKAPDIKMDFIEADVLKPGDWPEVLKGTTGLFHLATIDKKKMSMKQGEVTIKMRFVSCLCTPIDRAYFCCLIDMLGFVVSFLWAERSTLNLQLGLIQAERSVGQP